MIAPLMPKAVATLELALSHAHPGVATTLVPTPFPQLTPDLRDGGVDALLTFRGVRTLVGRAGRLG